MERRSSLRVPCGILVEVLVEDACIQAELMNISQKGMFLRSNLRSPMDSLRMASAMTQESEVVLQVSLASAELQQQATGCVAWKSDMGVGVDFHYLSSELSAFIEQLAHNPQEVAQRLSQIVGAPQVIVRTPSESGVRTS